MFKKVEKIVVVSSYTQRLEVSPLKDFDLKHYASEDKIASIHPILQSDVDIKVLYGWQRAFFKKLTGFDVPIFVFSKHQDLGVFLENIGIDNKTIVYVLEGKDFSYYYDPKTMARFVFLPSFAALLPYTRKATGGNKLHIEVSFVELRNLIRKTKTSSFWNKLYPFPSFKFIPMLDGEMVLVNLGRDVVPSKVHRVISDKDIEVLDKSLREADVIVFDVEVAYPFSSSKVESYETILSSLGVSMDSEFEFDGSEGKVVPKILPVTEIGIIARKGDKEKIFYVNATPANPHVTLSDLFYDKRVREEFSNIIQVCKKLVNAFQRKDVVIVGHNVKFDIVKVLQMIMVDEGRLLSPDEIEKYVPGNLWDTLVFRISRNTMSSPNALKRLAGIMGYPDWGGYIDTRTEDVFWNFARFIDYMTGSNSQKFKKYFPKEWGRRTPYIWGDFLVFVIEAAREYMKKAVKSRKASVEKELYPDWSIENLPPLNTMFSVSSDPDFSISKIFAEEIFNSFVGVNLSELEERYGERDEWETSFFYFVRGVLDDLWRFGSWADYNLIDIVATSELFDTQKKEVEGKEYKNILDVIYPFLIKVESYGVKIDIDRYIEMRNKLGNKLESISPELFGVNSRGVPKATQTVKLLGWFKELGVQYGEEYLTSLSTTSKSALEKIIEDNSGDSPSIKNDVVRNMAVGVAHYVLLYRLLTKVGTLYSKHWLKRFTIITPEGVFVLPSFNVDGTASGRLSSSDPNMQNLPSDRALFSAQKHFPELEDVFKFKKLIRSKFDRGVIGDIDFSQAEVRVMVIFSKDPVMYRAYKEGKDVYKVNASLVTGLPEDEIDDETRQFFKAITLGTMYGAGVKRLVSLGIPEDKAREFKEKFEKEFPSLSRYIDWVRFNFEHFNWTGFSLFRRRSFGDLVPRDLLSIDEFKKLIRREFPSFINMPIQSSSSDLTVLSAIELSNIFRSFGLKSHVINMVHDSIVLDIPEEELYIIEQIVKSFFNKGLYKKLIELYWDYVQEEVRPMIDFNMICPSKADFEIVSKGGA